MKYKLTGVSTPIGGISWAESLTAKQRFKNLLFFLESKRILTNPTEMEIKEHCIQSVLEIKSVIVETTKDVDFPGKDMGILRSLITACNQYLDSVNNLKLSHIIYKSDDIKNSWYDIDFDKAMKSFRNEFRTNISEIEKIYKLSFNKTIPYEY